MRRSLLLIITARATDKICSLLLYYYWARLTWLSLGVVPIVVNVGVNRRERVKASGKRRETLVREVELGWSAGTFKHSRCLGLYALLPPASPL